MKRKISTEAAYLIGMVSLCIGVTLMGRADFGFSMVVAPAYILHLKISEYLPFFSFGMSEYVLQAVLLILMIAVIRRFKISYLFSFVTAVIYGFMLDGIMWLFSFVPFEGVAFRIFCFLLGMFCSSVGVAMFFRTYISPEVYELFVKEISDKYKLKIHRVKTCYDCTSLGVSVALSFAFFGFWHFEGINIGTVICSLCNGWLIGKISEFYDKHFEFTDKFSWRRFFER